MVRADAPDRNRICAHAVFRNVLAFRSTTRPFPPLVQSFVVPSLVCRRLWRVKPAIPISGVPAPSPRRGCNPSARSSAEQAAVSSRISFPVSVFSLLIDDDRFQRVVAEVGATDATRVLFDHDAGGEPEQRAVVGEGPIVRAGQDGAVMTSTLRDATGHGSGAGRELLSTPADPSRVGEAAAVATAT